MKDIIARAVKDRQFLLLEMLSPFQNTFSKQGSGNKKSGLST